MEKCIIVAVADNMAIGRDNALLWHIAEDMKFLRSTTVGSPIIMGRKTYESIGRPLPKRTNIVVTRSMPSTEGLKLAASLEQALALAGETDAEKCFIMGGGQIYRQAMPLADRLYVTHVHVCIDDADTFFPEIDMESWEVESRSEIMVDPETGYSFEFVVYIRK